MDPASFQRYLSELVDAVAERLVEVGPEYRDAFQRVFRAELAARWRSQFSFDDVVVEAVLGDVFERARAKSDSGPDTASADSLPWQ